MADVGGFSKRNAERIGRGIQKIERLSSRLEATNTHTPHQRVCRVKLNDDLVAGGGTGTGPVVTGNLMIPNVEGDEWIERSDLETIQPIYEPDAAAPGASEGDELWVVSLANKWIPLFAPSPLTLMRYTGEDMLGTGTGTGTGLGDHVAGPFDGDGMITEGVCRKINASSPLGTGTGTGTGTGDTGCTNSEDTDNEYIVDFTYLRPLAFVFPGDYIWATKRGSCWYAVAGGTTQFRTENGSEFSSVGGYVDGLWVYPFCEDEEVPTGSVIEVTFEGNPQLTLGHPFRVTVICCPASLGTGTGTGS